MTVNEPLITVVSEALQALPEVCMKSVVKEPRLQEGRPDFEMLLEVRGEPLRLLIEEKKAAYPRDVFAMTRQLSPHANGTTEIPTLPMLIAPALPLSSREILRKEHVAYGDSGGSLYLAFAGALFYIDKPVPRSPVRKALNIYKGKAAQVLHTLLSAPDRVWHVNEMAQEAGVVSSTVHDVFAILEEQLWVERKGKGPEVVRVLREPGALLNAWRDEYSLKQYEFAAYYGMGKDPRSPSGEPDENAGRGGDRLCAYPGVRSRICSSLRHQHREAKHHCTSLYFPQTYCRARQVGTRQ